MRAETANVCWPPPTAIDACVREITRPTGINTPACTHAHMRALEVKVIKDGQLGGCIGGLG